MQLGALVPGHPAHSEVNAAVRKGLGWIDSHLEYLLPEDWRNPEHIKEIAELSILYSAFVSWRVADRERDLGKMAGLLHHFLDDRKISDWVRKLPTHYSPYVVAYLPLRAIGARIAGFEEAIAAMRHSGHPRALETNPYRELELDHLTWKAGLRREAPGCAGVYQRTSLARCVNPVYSSVPEVYSITHTIIYVTDIAGSLKMPAAERAKAVSIVEPLAVHYWRKRDWDLTGELLLNLVSLDRSDTPLFRAAFVALLDAWRADGALPGPGPAELKEDTPVREVVTHCYHTTLVGLLLCGAYLYRAKTNEA